MTPDEIRQLRDELHCSARELANTLKVDIPRVLAWEKGELFPTKRHVLQMQRLRDAGPDGIIRTPRGKDKKTPMARLSDPAFWEVVRKLLEHPSLYDQVVKLARDYDDPNQRS